MVPKTGPAKFQRYYEFHFVDVNTNICFLCHPLFAAGQGNHHWKKHVHLDWYKLLVPQIVNDVNMLCGAGVTSIKKAILFVRHGMQHLHETLVGPHRLYPNGKFPDGMTKQERAQLLEDPDTGATWNSIEDFFLHHSCCAWLLAELHRAESEMNDCSNREADRQQRGGSLTDDDEEEEEKKESD